MIVFKTSFNCFGLWTSHCEQLTDLTHEYEPGGIPYIFTTPKPSLKKPLICLNKNQPLISRPTPSHPNISHQKAPNSRKIPSPKNPGRLCLKDKVARTNVFEWIIFGIPFCHQAILSSTMSWMSWASGNSFFGRELAIFFWKGCSQQLAVSFGERQYF